MFRSKQSAYRRHPAQFNVQLCQAIGVKLSSPGPVIFKQRRNGLEGEEIIVCKFHSMTTQDNALVVRQATRNDARSTTFGAFMRRTSLDKLPQLINGLRGKTDTLEKMQLRVEYDLEYLRNWSLTLDLQIILRTMRVAFIERHAY